MKILIINNAEKGITDFVTPLHDIAVEYGNTTTIIEYLQAPGTNHLIYDGIILSGSPCGDDIVAHHLPYFQWIPTCPIPIFGICAGHHIVGALFGAELLRSKEIEVGENTLHLIERDPIFKECPDTFRVHQNHHDSITLPNNFKLLASSDGCKVAMMKHINFSIYTTQFHPEVLNKKVLFNFFSLVKELNRRENA